MEQKINQASLKDEGIEEHEEDDDDIEEDGNVLNAVGGKKLGIRTDKTPATSRGQRSFGEQQVY